MSARLTLILSWWIVKFCHRWMNWQWWWWSRPLNKIMEHSENVWEFRLSLSLSLLFLWFWSILDLTDWNSSKWFQFDSIFCSFHLVELNFGRVRFRIIRSNSSVRYPPPPPHHHHRQHHHGYLYHCGTIVLMKCNQTNKEIESNSLKINIFLWFLIASINSLWFFQNYLFKSIL